MPGFNPLVGIPVVHANPPQEQQCQDLHVSIPWSGFRSFTRLRADNSSSPGRFNPLVGIPVVHASGNSRASVPKYTFQSPGRDSGRSRWPELSGPTGDSWFQSPGRDSGRSRTRVRRRRPAAAEVSIPWSGFRSFTLRSVSPRSMALKFQSPGRDSGRSRSSWYITPASCSIVSIPWSGFRSFTPVGR